MTTTQTLPQLDGELVITDAGCETDLIFNKGVPIREFAAHTLLSDDAGRSALADYYRGFLSLASDLGVGMVLDAPTWKAHSHWATDLGSTEDELADANRDAVAFSRSLRDEYAAYSIPVVVNGLVGPRGDAYAPETLLSAVEAETYHRTQIQWLADAGADMVSALTFTHTEEAVGAVRAAQSVGIPIVVSFTVETDGHLPTGEALGTAVQRLDQLTDAGAAYLMVNCAHPDHIRHALDDDDDWTQRIRGLRCNASRQSHAELDAAEQLDDGDPAEFAEGYLELRRLLPRLNVVGGCCGSDLRHVTAVAHAFAASPEAAHR
jgi:S-methylmethionine-dependent homocysteine/selenocysteine methylase